MRRDQRRDQEPNVATENREEIPSFPAVARGARMPSARILPVTSGRIESPSCADDGAHRIWAIPDSKDAPSRKDRPVSASVRLAVVLPH